MGDCNCMILAGKPLRKTHSSTTCFFGHDDPRASNSRAFSEAPGGQQLCFLGQEGKQLCFLGRAALPPGKSRKATFDSPCEQLCFLGRAAKQLCLPGRAALPLGTSRKAALPLRTSVVACVLYSHPSTRRFI